MSGADAKDMIDAGASLVEIYSGFIYEGPGLVKKIIKHLENETA
jgi:dihydroorotate dehydrogenase